MDFVAGLVAGAALGVLVLSLCAAAREERRVAVARLHLLSRDDCLRAARARLN